MNCGWCGSDKLECEFVDIGVGQQQVTPYECISCGASQVTPDHFLNPGCEIDREDARRGWYAGPDSHANAIPVPPTMRLVNRDTTVRARDFPYGQRVLVCWLQMTHIAYKTMHSKNGMFMTLCQQSFAIATTPVKPFVSCLVCATTED